MQIQQIGGFKNDKKQVTTDIMFQFEHFKSGPIL